jgi:threonine dehydratase
MAYAGQVFGVRTTICVPEGNNPDKNAGMVSLGAHLVEEGKDFDEALAVASRLVASQGAIFGHSTDDPHVLAGAATIAAEMLDEAPQLDAMVIGVGGGSQAVGAIVVAESLKPSLRIYGVQAEGAAAAHDSWHAGERLTTPRATTFADGLATRATYNATFPVLREGLEGFVTVPDAAIAEACRLLMRYTHSMVEGAAAVGLAGVLALRDTLAGKTVGIILTGANIDGDTLRQVINEEI